QAAGPRLGADTARVQPPQQQDQGLAAPAAAEQAEGARAQVQDPVNDQGGPGGAEAAFRPGRQALQRRQPLALEAALPAGDGATGAVQGAGDGVPAAAVAQQQEDVGTQPQRGVEGAAIVAQQRGALVGGERDRMGQGPGLRGGSGLCVTVHHRVRLFLITRAADGFLVSCRYLAYDAEIMPERQA